MRCKCIVLIISKHGSQTTDAGYGVHGKPVEIKVWDVARGKDERFVRMTLADA